jgi:hypothetical protein
VAGLTNCCIVVPLVNSVGAGTVETDLAAGAILGFNADFHDARLERGFEATNSDFAAGFDGVLVERAFALERRFAGRGPGIAR